MKTNYIVFVLVVLFNQIISWLKGLINNKTRPLNRPSGFVGFVRKFFLFSPFSAVPLHYNYLAVRTFTTIDFIRSNQQITNTINRSF